jgi:hypothetical protein
MVQSASGAGGPPEAIITGISRRMVYRPSVSGRNRDGRAQTPARMMATPAVTRPAPVRIGETLNSTSPRSRLLGQITPAAAMMS